MVSKDLWAEAANLYNYLVVREDIRRAERIIEYYPTLLSHEGFLHRVFMEPQKILPLLYKLKKYNKISNEQFSSVVNSKNPQTGETLVTDIIKRNIQLIRDVQRYKEKGDAASVERSFAAGKRENELLTFLLDESNDYHMDVNIINERGQYALWILEEAVKDPIYEGLEDAKKLLEEKTSFEVKEKIRNSSEQMINEAIFDDTQVMLATAVTAEKGTEPDFSTGAFKLGAFELRKRSYLASRIEDPFVIATIYPAGKYLYYKRSNADGVKISVVSNEKFSGQQEHVYLKAGDEMLKFMPKEVFDILTPKK